MANGESLSDSIVLRAAARVAIDVPRLPLQRVVTRAIKHFNARAAFGTRPASVTSDPAFLERIAVNYLRHASRYDNSRNYIRGSRVADEAGLVIKRRTLLQIAQLYPTLAEECARQAARSGD